MLGRVQTQSSAKVLEHSLAGFRGRLTAADAAARSGLATRDAAAGLAALGAECAGHLAVTEKGELIYEFPRGLVRTGRPALWRRIGRGLARAAYGLVRFVVRAWLSVVLVGYALVFAAVLIVLAAKSDDGGGIGDVLATLAYVLAESLYWTFHPFSPVYLASEPLWVQRGKRSKRVEQAADVPFYERVNRFVFGPPPAAVDPRADLAKAVVEIRRQQGRVVPADIMRVTGGSREAAERTLLRLVADHEGEITVSDEGAILYEFPGLRATAEARGAADLPIWKQLAVAPPLTGNSVAFNVLFSAINGFNLTMGSVALAQGWTIERLIDLAARVGVEKPPPLPPPDGIPLALGLVPFLFSAALFAIPLVRALGRRATAARVARDNHLRLLLRHLLARPEDARRFRFARAELTDACTVAGRRPTEAEVERAVRALGGSVDIAESGALVYTFDDLAREHAAVRAARALASPDEASPGRVLLSSADEGHGLRPEVPVRPRRPR
jgi:hypothetical protein